MTLKVTSPKVYTVQGVPLSVTGIAQVKITSSNEEMLRAAVEQFIDKEPKEIEDVAMSTLEGHQVLAFFKTSNSFTRVVFFSL